MPGASEGLPAGPPLGFPKCPRCPYVQAGPARICIECAGATLEHIANRSCPVCDQFLDDNGNCPNWLCTDPGRRIKKISAIAYSSGSLRNKIISYKYDGVTGWSLIFARLLIGWLQRNAGADPPGILVANPTYVDPRSGQIGHTERVLRAAEREDALGRWPFDAGDPAVLIKAEPTTHSAGSSAAAKRAAASDLRRTLRITDRSQIVDRDVLVYDDVCTTGSQLNTIAGFLLDEGQARSVSAIVLARAPWRAHLPQE